MRIEDILRTLDLGSSVAEFDQMIDRHFFVTNAYKGLIEGKADIVAGDKGAGKTTIYRYLQHQYTMVNSGPNKIVYYLSGIHTERRLCTVLVAE
jgi:predicted ATP-dependent serine protease